MINSCDRSRKIRGAVLVESAIVLIYILGLFFAGFQIGLISYYQLAMDSGSQMQARAYALGDTAEDAKTQVVQVVLPKLTHATFNAIATPAPIQIATNNADFGYSNPNARTGGASADVALPVIASLKQNTGLLSLGTTAISIESYAIEGQMRELCPHYCLIKGGIAKAKTTDAVDYYQAGDNTTPYFIGFNFMRTCGSSPTADLSTPTTFGWNSCTADNVVWRALGTAAHLDQSNALFTGHGVENSSYHGLQHSAPTAEQVGPFFEVWCHRNIYASIALKAFPYPTIPALPNNLTEAHTFLAQIFGPDPASNPGTVIYHNAGGDSTVANGGWDSSQIQGSTESVSIKDGNLSPWWGCGVY